MSRLLSGRRASSTPHVFKKSQPQRLYKEDLPTPGPPPPSVVNKAYEMQTNHLILKLESKLPCNSGHSLNAVERDHVMEHIVVALVQMALTSPDYIIWSLCTLLEKLHKRALPGNALPDDVLDSQLYVLKTLTRVLNDRWAAPSPDDGVLPFPAPIPDPLSSPPTSTSPLHHSPSWPHPKNHPINKVSQSSLRSESTSKSWTEPSPLDGHVARYALSVALIFLRDTFNGNPGGGSHVVRQVRSIRPGARLDGSMFSWDVADWEPALAPPLRPLKRSIDAKNASVTAWEQTALPVTGASDIGTFGPAGSAHSVVPGGKSLYTMYAHDYARDVCLHGSYLASVSVLVTKYAGRVVFNLSASNWSVVFDRVKTRLLAEVEEKSEDPPPSLSIYNKKKDRFKNHKSNSEYPPVEFSSHEDVDDSADLRLLNTCLMDHSRLMDVLQEFVTLFSRMSSHAQDVACIALRAAIWNWVEYFPRELGELWTSPTTDSRKRRILGGLPERAFDILLEITSQHPRRTAWLYPVLGSLISICPERLKAAAEALDGVTKVSRKNNFLRQLSNASNVSSSRNLDGVCGNVSEHAAIAHLDIVRAAFCLPPTSTGARECALYTLGSQLALELKRFMVHPPNDNPQFYASREAIDVNFYAYCIAAVFRFHPKMALEEIMQVCLEPRQSQAIKLTAIKALILLVTEKPKYPWQPSLETAYSSITPRNRSICVALLAGRPERINGVLLPPATYPTCKSLVQAATIPGMLNEIDEDLRLLVGVETLFTLEPAFWLYGTTDEDHGGSQDDARSILAPHRDKRAKAATMMALCAMMTRTLNITPDTPWYPQGLRYLWFTVPTALASVPLLLLNAPGDDHEFHRMGVACLHSMLLEVANGSPYSQDQSWRFSPFVMGTMPLVELALWTALSSSQMDISTAAQRCLRLISLIERNEALLPPAHLTPEEFSKRCTVLEGLGDPRVVIVGRMAFLKRICKHIAMMSFSSPTHVMMFRQYLWRWSALTRKVDYKENVPGSTGGMKDELHEWQNKMCILTVAAGFLLTDEALPFPAHLDAVLPEHLQGFVRPVDMVKQFLNDMVGLLSAETLAVRDMAKDALANDMHMRLLPLFSDVLTEKLAEHFNPDADKTVTLIYVEQLLYISAVLLDRLDTDGLNTVFENPTSSQLMSIGTYISSLPVDTRSLRLRVRFCVTVNALLAKRHLTSIRNENKFLNDLVDLLGGWIVRRPYRATQTMEYRRAAMDAHVAALRTFVKGAEKMHIEDGISPEGAQNASRQFNRYLSTLISARVTDKGSSNGAFDNDFDKNDEALIHELVVSGIAYLLSNNVEAGVKHCVALCYDQDSRLRVLLMKAFTRVLNLGTKFDLQQIVPPDETRIPLCDLLRECQMILFSLIEACPPGDVDRMVPVLLNVFNTRTSIVDFLKLLIEREVAKTTDPKQLFRSNDLCARLLSAFARQHGYGYLRSILFHLIEQMKEVPVGSSFELDPSKLGPGEDLQENVNTLLVITQAFIDVIVDSASALPPVMREISHHISQVVSAAFPEHKHAALGAFLFLRFLSPAMVSPEIVDIDISRNDPRAPSIHRGLILVAKIIQNLSNNISFSKEKYLLMLNPFLEENVMPVNSYLNEAQTLAVPTIDEEEKIGPGCDETDALFLHRFFQAHMDKIGKRLLAQSGPSDGRSKFATGKDAWDSLCSQLVEMGAALDVPNPSGVHSSQHRSYQNLMLQNRNRAVDSLRGIFTAHVPISNRVVFVFAFHKIDVDVLDFDLLLYLIFKSVAEVVEKDREFEVVFDFTGFTARSELPIAWLKLALELLPCDFQQRWCKIYILNLNSLSKLFLRRVLYIFANLRLMYLTEVASAIAELPDYVQASLASSYAASVEYQDAIRFDVDQKTENQQSWAPVHLIVGDQHLRMTSRKMQEVSPDVSVRIVELVHLREIEDVHLGNNQYQVVVRRIRRAPSVIFSSKSSERILKTIRAAKERTAASKAVVLPTSYVSDMSAALLAIGLLHACHELEHIRTAASELLTANCTFMGYPSNAQIPWRGSFVPANSLAFIINFSECVSDFVPNITVDFIREWSVGFAGADSRQKTTCLQYLSPWLRNLSSFLNPKSGFFDASGSKVRDCIRIFVDITMQDPEVYGVIQRAVWVELGKSTSEVINIILDELISVAISSGSGSRRCEVVADTLIALSSIHTRAKVLKELRMFVSHACHFPTRTLTETADWKAICALSRLTLVAGHTPRLATQNQLYAPEIAHLVTMLAATGTLSMRLSIYGIAMNLVQALHVARAEDEAAAAQLHLMLDDMASPEYLKFFGLNRHYPSSDITISEPSSDQISVESLERITFILLRALELGSSSTGLRNVWGARWMSLVTATAFQSSFHSQSRAFTVLGNLAGSTFDDDIFYQMLMAFRKNLQNSHEDNDMSAVLSMLRCMRKTVLGLPPDSRYLGSVFWLAVSLIQAGIIPCFGEAVQLIKATIETMDRYTMFSVSDSGTLNPLERVLMAARAPLSEAVVRLDEISGLSFGTSFGFSLVSALWRGIRVRNDIGPVREVLYTIARAAARMANPKGEPRAQLDLLTTPLFIGLAPCLTREEYAQFLEKDLHVSRSAPEFPSSGSNELGIDLSLLDFADSNAIFLATSLILNLDDSYILNAEEKENIHVFWAEFAKYHTDVFCSGLFHFMDSSTIGWIFNKMDSLFSASSSPAHLRAITTCCHIVMSRVPMDGSFAGSSTTSLETENGTGAPSIHSLKDDAFGQILTEIGMTGVVRPLRAFPGANKNDYQRMQTVECVTELIRLIIAQ